MAKEPNRMIGKIDCMVCGEEMPVRQNGRDTLNLSCPWCGHSSYAKGGTGAHEIVSVWLRKDDSAAQAAQAAKPATPVPAVPQVKKQPTATIFG